MSRSASSDGAVRERSSDAGEATTTAASTEVAAAATSLHRWSQGCVGAGLLLPNPDTTTKRDTADCGFSLAYLHDLSVRLTTLLPRDTDSAGVVQRMILPLTNSAQGRAKAPRCRFYDFVPPKHTGTPHIYVVHPWGMPFRLMVEQLMHSLAPVADRVNINTADRYTELYIWLDLICLNQHPAPSVHADVSLVREVLKSCAGGVAFVVDSERVALTRTWCLYEAWSCIHLKDITKITVCLPVEALLDDLLKFEAAVKALDIAQSETTKSEDKTRMLSEIRGSVGMKRMQSMLNEGLLGSVRAALRWSHDFKDLAIYCTLLLLNDETIRLQQVLHHIPELINDDKTLEDIENIFQVCLPKATNRLNDAAFVRVLEAAGFGLEEARSIFKQITRGSKEGVGIDEFKDWWLHSSRQESLHYSRPPVLTSEALADNLRRMKELLERKDMDQMADLFKNALQDHLDGRTLPPGSMLTGGSTLFGEWRQICNELLSKLHCQDFRGAITLLHGLLMWNRASMDENPDTLVRADVKRMDMAAVFKTLARCLETLVEMLHGHANHRQHCKSYVNFIAKLQSPDFLDSVIDKMGSGPGSPAQSHNRITTTQLRTELERHAVVRSMIGLKYGDGSPIDNSMIAEAEISLGKILCMPKAGGGFASPDRTDAVTMMSRNYLLQGPLGVDKAKQLETQKPLRFRKLDLEGDSQNESVLLSLGPEAVAFYASQQQQQQAEAAAAEAAKAAGGAPAAGGEESTSGRPMSSDQQSTEGSVIRLGKTQSSPLPADARRDALASKLKAPEFSRFSRASAEAARPGGGGSGGGAEDEEAGSSRGDAGGGALAGPRYPRASASGADSPTVAGGAGGRLGDGQFASPLGPRGRGSLAGMRPRGSLNGHDAMQASPCKPSPSGVPRGSYSGSPNLLRRESLVGSGLPRASASSSGSSAGGGLAARELFPPMGAGMAAALPQIKLRGGAQAPRQVRASMPGAPQQQLADGGGGRSSSGGGGVMGSQQEQQQEHVAAGTHWLDRANSCAAIVAGARESVSGI